MAYLVEFIFRIANQYLPGDIQNRVFVWYIKDLILAIFQFCMVYYIKTLMEAQQAKIEIEHQRLYSQRHTQPGECPV